MKWDPRQLGLIPYPTVSIILDSSCFHTAHNCHNKADIGTAHFVFLFNSTASPSNRTPYLIALSLALLKPFFPPTSLSLSLEVRDMINLERRKQELSFLLVFAKSLRHSQAQTGHGHLGHHFREEMLLTSTKLTSLLKNGGLSHSMDGAEGDLCSATAHLAPTQRLF